MLVKRRRRQERETNERKLVERREQRDWRKGKEEKTRVRTTSMTVVDARLVGKERREVHVNVDCY